MFLFDQDELETWLKQGRVDCNGEVALELSAINKLEQAPEVVAGVVDISSQRVYHRNGSYQ